jgi:hypothetical protein
MAGERYRKLPGRRRGLVKGASLWIGADHLLSVKSMRIREEYKRFHFGDVQAIAVARAPRFHVSTRLLMLVILWLAAYLAAAGTWPRYTWVLWILGAALLLAWILISARFSCRCRIYTAVSRDELPSLYRIWTARKFLKQVTPRIAAVQGAVDANWAEAAEERNPGPPARLPGALPNARDPLRPKAQVHTLIADLFVATLLTSALADLLLLHSTSARTNWTEMGFGLALIAETVLLFVQYFRGLLQGAMQKLAIANLIAIGVMYYARQMIFSYTMAAKQPNADLRIPTFYAGDTLTRGIDAGICIILGLVGLGIIFLRKPLDD